MELDHLVGGAVNGTIFVLVAIVVARYTRQILGSTLVVAALAYVGFAVQAHAGAAWLVAELAGVALFGWAAWRGTRGSAWWLVAGWAAHPLWDVVLHHVGPGRGVAPEWYTTSCVTFDLMVAGIAAIAIAIGTHLSEPQRSTPTFVAPIGASPCSCGCAWCTGTEARAA